MAASRKKLFWLIFFLALAAGAASLVGLARREKPVLVQTEKVARRNLTELVVANGKIQPVLQVKISPEVSGEIIELPVKEGQAVSKGDLILKIKPDFYLANRNQAQASYNSSIAGRVTAEATLQKAEAEFKRNTELFERRLISDSVFLDVKTARDIAAAQLTNSIHQVEMSRALLARAEEELAKTTIVSPLTGTVSKLNSQIGERVVGTATMAGTDVMIIADLNTMEARVDIGEMDVVLIRVGQTVRLEVDAFKDRKFSGVVTEIANSSKGAGNGLQAAAATTSQDATKFEVKVRIQDKEAFRPGMSVTAEIETQYRTNVLTVPMASVTTRPPPKPKDAQGGATNSLNGSTPADSTLSPAERRAREKELEVVFVAEGDRAKLVPVKRGISDETHWEILAGLTEGQEVISGGFRAISRDLEDGKRIRRGPPPTARKNLADDRESAEETR